MSEPSVERILEDFARFRKAYPTIFSIQENLERLRDDYISKSYHKQQLRKSAEILQNQNKTLHERINKLEEENQKYKNECVLIGKRKELMECELNEKISSLKIENETFRDRLDYEIEESEQRETKLRKEKQALQNELEELKKRNQTIEDEFGRLKQQNQSLHNNFTENQNKFNDIKTKNSELMEDLKILELKNDGLEHAKKGLQSDKKGLELELKQIKRQFESLSKESPEIASKICKKQGYAITSGNEGKPLIKMEPGEITMDTKISSRNFMCRDCYSGWLSKIPKSGDLTMAPNPLEEIKMFSSQSDLKAHILTDHISANVLKCWQEGSTYICQEPDLKNGTCSFRTNSEHQYNMHLKVDHAKVQFINIYQIYGLKSYLFNLKSFRPITQYHSTINPNIIPRPKGWPQT